MYIDIVHLVKAFRTVDWISELETVVPSPPPLVPTAWITSLLEANKVVSRIRRTGLLRASKYQYQGDLLTRVVQTLLNRQATISIPADGATYLESVTALLFVAPLVRQPYEDIRRELRKRRRVVLKSLVAVVDHRFIA